MQKEIPSSGNSALAQLIRPKLGWISCAILQANPKRLQRFFSSPGLGPLIRGENHASHLSCLLFCPKLVCSVTIKSRKDYQVLCLKSNVEK